MSHLERWRAYSREFSNVDIFIEAEGEFGSRRLFPWF